MLVIDATRPTLPPWESVVAAIRHCGSPTWIRALDFELDRVAGEALRPTVAIDGSGGS